MKENTAEITSRIIHPNILYYGTPVLLLSTLNEDHSTNITPISSSWALGDCIVLGLGVESKAFENISQLGECVLNIPHPPLWQHVEKLAHYTGKNPVPEYKRKIGFQLEKDKFRASGLTPVPSQSVKPERIKECPIQIEARIQHIRIPEHTSFFSIVETQAVHVHVHENIILRDNYINPERWSPLIYNFRHYFALGKQLGKTFRAET
ncbi:flavin reductase family protein [Lihuaxuella thermophila]|uniref:NADH-FMN oxidoreductase RutF, flavin reductase (DIM6/NTAB) family n=1 Tax=Lihuaxuella thermophila TaxID=1173111 RepID=A0A1H8JMB0_9BACL|nr:flavin reductase family protein [Lihuaxuella thermophila]SEN81894.1 NADH-FMN oxidoreductase RutF, flavin reductase (DIM6/NTAB) family [Lihuaxuella thermophila]